MAKGKIREQKGITLGVLALTIVIIIILATVTINLVFGDNGLINQAQTAKEMAEVSSIKEKMEMVKADTYIEGQGKIDPDDFFEKLEQEGIIGDKDTDVVDNGDGSYEVTVEPDYVFEVTLKPSKDDANDAEIDYVGKGENQGPRIKEIKVVSQTENSVSIEVTARNAEGGTYTYSYKKEGEPSWIDVASNNSNTYEYTNLEENTTYDIKVKVETSEGTSEKEIKVTIGKTAEVPEGTITFGEAEWSGYRASVTVSTSAQDYTIEYQVNGTEDRQWRTVDNGGTVEDLYNGDKVYARITDGEQASSPQEKQILDTKAPAQANIELNKTELTAGESLTAKVTHIDNESGAEISQSKWIMNTSAGAIGTDAGSYTGTFSSNGETITLESKSTGEYYLHVLTVDKAGNKTETISNKITINKVEGAITQKGQITWSRGKASIELETAEGQYTIEYKVNSGEWKNYSGPITNLNHGDKVTARLTNGVTTGEETVFNITDETNPVVTVTAGGTTTNSITVNVQAVDNESGMTESIQYTYYIKQTSEQDSAYQAKATDITQNSYTFTGLTQGISYDVKVEAKADKAGHVGTGTLTNQTTGTLPGGETGVEQGAITFSSATWSAGKASITISTNTSNTIEYQVNTTSEGSWKTISSGGTVGELSHGDTVFARLTDGTNHGDEASTNILDGVNPANATIQLNTESLVAGESLTAKVTHIDNESGVEMTQCKWIMNTSAGAIGIDSGSYTGTFSSNGETITLESSATGEYYLHVLTVDKAGNKTETISNKITIGNITGTVKQKGETTWSSGKASIELEATETQYTIEYKINSGSWTNYSGTIGNLNHGDKVTARLTNGTVTGSETTIEIKDENDPVVIVTPGGTTTNSVTVSVSASDNESGMTENVTYTYYIKKTGEGDASYSSPSGASNISQTNYTFTNLDQGTSYDVKVEAKADKAGNIGTGSLPNQTTATIGGASEGLEEGNIVAGPVTWKNEKASTTLTTSTGLQIQYQINDTAEGSWQTISNGGTVGNLNHGDTVFARLYDGKNHGDYASVNILDGTPPTVQISVGEITKNSIAVSVTANDGQSGLATSNTYKYYLNGALKDTLTTNSYTFTGLTAETQYTIKVEAYDKANNAGSDTTNAKTEKEPELFSDIYTSTKQYTDSEGNTAWIPRGFAVGTSNTINKISDGLVITDAIDGNHESTGNQFVWIPVPDYTTMYGTGTYTLCGVSTQTSVYSKLRQRSGDSYKVTTPGSTSQIREPDLVTNYDTSSTYYSILASSAKAMADDMVAEYTATYNSIKKYKGFYIGRYELTGTVSSPTVKKGQTVLSADIAGNWYYLKKACTNIVSSSYAQSTMVYGNQWDEIMSWLVSSGGKTSSEVNTNSSSWGNYSNSTGAAATNSGSKQTSGKNEAWKANNIYDLAGNCREWTQEASYTSYRIGRGR